VDNLLSYLPPTLLVLAQEVDDSSSVDRNPETAKAAMEALSLDQKKDILRKTLRSPQFSQSLGSLTMAFGTAVCRIVMHSKSKWRMVGSWGEVGCHLAVEKLLKHSKWGQAICRGRTERRGKPDGDRLAPV
jgi:hypothetical protein